MTIDDFRRKVCDIIDLYVDRPEHFYLSHKEEIIELARRWGPEVFLGALEACCLGSSLPYFFSGETEKWRDVYFDSLFRGATEKGRLAFDGLTIELVPEKTEEVEKGSQRVDKFLKELKEACRSGRIREMSGAYRPY